MLAQHQKNWIHEIREQSLWEEKSKRSACCKKPNKKAKRGAAQSTSVPKCDDEGKHQMPAGNASNTGDCDDLDEDHDKKIPAKKIITGSED